MRFLRHSIKIGSMQISLGYIALILSGSLFANTRLLFHPSAVNNVEGFLYLVWEGALPQTAIIFTCASILFITGQTEKKEISKLKSNLLSCCFGGIILFISILCSAIIAEMLFPTLSTESLSSNIQNSIFGTIYPIWNGWLLFLTIAIIAFLGGSMWASFATFFSKVFDDKLFGVASAIILYYIFNAILNNSAVSSSLMFPTLLTHIPVYVIILLQSFFLILICFMSTKVKSLNIYVLKAKLKLLYLFLPFAIVIIYSIICIRPIFNAAAYYGYSINILEPLCFLFSTERSIVILNTICIIVACSYKRVKGEKYVVYILKGLAFVLTFYLVIVVASCLLFATKGYISNDWSEFTYYYTHTSLSKYITDFQLTFSSAYMAVSQPIGFLLSSMGLCALLSLLSMAIVQFFKIFKTDKNVIVVLLLQEIWKVMCKMNIFIQFFSPLAHAIIGNHSFGYDYKPTLQLSAFVLFGLTVFLHSLNYLIQSHLNICNEEKTSFKICSASEQK